MTIERNQKDISIFHDDNELDIKISAKRDSSHISINQDHNWILIDSGDIKQIIKSLEILLDNVYTSEK